jgi:DNA modification methylase
MAAKPIPEPACLPDNGAAPSPRVTSIWEVALRRVEELRPNPRNPRTHSKRQIGDLANTIKAVGFIGTIVVDETGMILAGHARHAAAKLAGLQEVPTLRVRGLSSEQIRAFVLADNKFAERAGWDRELLAAELEELSILLPTLKLDLSITGFEAAEIDVFFTDMGEDANAAVEDLIPPTARRAVSRRGDIWTMHKHRVQCGDAREFDGYSRLMQGKAASVSFTDPPYNVAIPGHAQGRGQIKHPNFAVGAGEMDSEEYYAFLKTCLGLAAEVSLDGAVHYVCMDWRHIETLIRASQHVYGDLLNLVVWNKTNSGQGSFYRSQHELIAVLRVGRGPHCNNVELGRHGRNRSNVWTYPGVNSFGTGRNEALAMHPTVKPVALVADALRDCTARGEVVLDPFLGSGTTLLAAEKAGRVCFGIELEPAYTDVAVRRWQAYAKADAVLEGDGRTFDEIAAARLRSAAAGDGSMHDARVGAPPHRPRRQGPKSDG